MGAGASTSKGGALAIGGPGVPAAAVSKLQLGSPSPAIVRGPCPYRPCLVVTTTQCRVLRALAHSADCPVQSPSGSPARLSQGDDTAELMAAWRQGRAPEIMCFAGWPATWSRQRMVGGGCTGRLTQGRVGPSRGWIELHRRVIDHHRATLRQKEIAAGAPSIVLHPGRWKAHGMLSAVA
jgi:hypothetical protein